MKPFLIIGNVNGVLCKDVFPLMKENKMWFGVTIHSGDRKFNVPDNYPFNSLGCGVDETGRRFISVKGVRWFTNLPSSYSVKPIELAKVYNEAEYPRYDNYNAVEVSRTKDIPMDYDGVMGVPVTFLDKYNASQFEIVGVAAGFSWANYRKDLLALGFNPDMKPGCGLGVPMLNGKPTYARILIRRKRK